MSGVGGNPSPIVNLAALNIARSISHLTVSMPAAPAAGKVCKTRHVAVGMAPALAMDWWEASIER